MFEAVIGLEIHAQLLTRTKLFCRCAAAGDDRPNSRTCPVCLGLPGVLPILNQAAVDQALRAAAALGCEILPKSEFSRKNYFYPDLPKGYQISQYDKPIGINGKIAWSKRGVAHDVRVVRVHIEEDAGKSLHDAFPLEPRATALDFNRAGVPLAEIVTAPDLRSPEDAAECFRQLRATLVEAGISDGNLEAGNLRCDANLSVRPAGSTGFGARTEIKNLNSYRFLERALTAEFERHCALLARGEAVEPATVLWDEHAHRTVQMRTKEGASEYRFFPEPDLPQLVVDNEWVARVMASIPESPSRRLSRLIATYRLSEEEAAVVGATPDSAAFFEHAAGLVRPEAVVTWMRGEIARWLNDTGGTVADLRLTPARLAGLIALVDEGRLSMSGAKQVCARMLETGEEAGLVVDALGLAMETDTSAHDAWIAAVLATHASVAAQHRSGKRGAFGFLIGQVMKISGGRARPSLVDERLRAALDRPEAS